MEILESDKNKGSEKRLSPEERQVKQKRWSELFTKLRQLKETGIELPAEEKQKIDEEMEQLRKEIS